MPLADGFFGTTTDGLETHEYCKFCFQDGEYLQPELTIEDMIDMSIQNMTQDLSMSHDQASELAHTVIPQLKRWKVQK
jgi:hypothetical protein